MSESKKAALAAGLAAGYVLGRGRKAKLAMAVAAYLATKKLQAKPQDLLAAGAEKLGDSGQLTQLVEQLRGEVLTVGREALKSMADRRLGSFADALADRTKSLNQVLEAAVEEAEGPQDQEEEAEKEAGAEERRGEGGAEERGGEGGRQRRGTRTAEGRARPRRTRRESEGQQAPAKKAAKKAPPRKAAKKSARNAAEPSRRRR